MVTGEHRERLQVVFDTNCICADFRFRSTVTNTILSNARAGRITVHIPAVCIDEAIAIFQRQLTEAQEPANKAAKVYRRLGIPVNFEVLDSEAIGSETNCYRETLLSELSANNVEIISYDRLPDHQPIVLRAIERRRPFLVDDEGYRDALVWEAVKLVALCTEGPIAFVSDDSGFKSGDRQRSLHMDLLEDLRNAEIDESRIERYDRLHNVIDSFEWLKDTSGEVEEWQRIQWIEDGYYPQFDLGEIVRSQIAPSLIGTQLDITGWSTPVSSDTVSIKAVDFGSIEIIGVCDETRDLVVVEASADADLSVDLLVPSWAVVSTSIPRELMIPHNESGSFYVPVEEATVTVYIDFDVRYNHTQQRVLDVEIKQIDIRYGSF